MTEFPRVTANGHKDIDDAVRELGPEAVREQIEQMAHPDPFTWLEDFELTDDEADEIAEPNWIEPGLIPEGHVVAIVAKPNGGKTTILFDLAKVLAKRGRTVIFVHADTNPSDAKVMREQAIRAGVRYLTPDMKIGLGMADVVKNLQALARSDADLSGHVWFFDTLKKMANVISKDSLKSTLMLMRKLSARGMTCVLLCHTNKYRNAEGQWQYEGTGDLEADCDELIYLEPIENPDGSLTVSTRCTKRRADIQGITWDITPDRTVLRRDEYVDVQAQLQADQQREDDGTAIEAISDVLSTGPKKQLEVMQHCKELKFTDKRIRAVLKRYSGDLWDSEKLFEKNAWRYTLR